MGHPPGGAAAWRDLRDQLLGRHRPLREGGAPGHGEHDAAAGVSPPTPLTTHTKNTSNLEIYAKFTAIYYKFTSNTLDFSPQVNALNWGIARGVGAAAGGKVCRGAWARVTVDRFRQLALQTF